MADTADASIPEIDDVRENIVLNETLLASLENDDGTDAEESRRVIRGTLRKLQKRLRSLQPAQPGAGAMPSAEELYPTLDGDHGSGSGTQGASFEQTHHLIPPPTFDLVSRKRQRGDFDDNPRDPKSVRATPSPSVTGAPSPAESVDSFDSFDFDDPILGSILPGYSREEGRGDRDYLNSLEERRRQEEEDAEFARLLQAEINQSNTPSFSQKQSSLPSTSFSQAFFKPDGSMRRPSPHTMPSQSMARPSQPNDLPHPSFSSTLINDAISFSSSDDELEEIPASEFTPRNQHTGGQHMPAPRTWLGSNISMPGAFPGAPAYAGSGGTSVYNTNPYNSAIYMPTSSSRLFGGLPGFPSLPGYSPALFDLDMYASFRDEWADPAKTQEELKELLKHVRPDEDLTAEQRAQMPIGLKAILMPHQASGLAWMKKMEDSTSKGGILADDMGLGKTLQSIALILARPPPDDDHRPTLVVAPVALMRQWKRELEKMIRSSHRLEILVLHGSSKPLKYSAIKNYDVVLTTYGTLAAELKKRLIWDEKLKVVPDARPSAKEECVVLGDQSKFHRVILDEAQNIKNRATRSALAACRINSTYRWCLSGTPMQNNVDEMYSLIKFCRIRPYNNLDKFSKDFTRPLKGRSEAAKDRAMQQLQVLLRAILLRRTKKSEIDGKPILQLPDKHTVENRAVFSKDELEFYQALEQKAQIQFNKYIQRGSIGRNYSHALVLLLRLRQACCHPSLITQSKDFMQTGTLEPLDLIKNAKALADDVVDRLKQLEAFECPVCMDANENPSIFPCGHALCEDCLSKLCDQALASEEGSQALCPHCRAPVDANKCTDHISFLRVHCPDREGVEPLKDDEAADTCTDSSDDDEDDPDDAADLKGFVVPDDVEDHDTDASDEGANNPSTSKSKSKSKTSTSRRKSEGKGKGKAKVKSKSLAELRKEGLRNKAAKRKYLKKLAKDWQTSAKIEKTLQLLEEIRGRGEGEKTIVFSSFTSFLDLIEVPLSRHPEFGVYARYDGSMSPNDRNEAVLSFTENRDCKVILVSLKAGNAGLNLTAANHVIILDPFWNPFVEYQAADRCYRIGQQREVTVHRVLIGEEDTEPSPDNDFTVEDRILRLQEKKRHLVETALDESAGQSVSRLGTRELGYLFGVNDLN